jgi:hypothetical protein
MAIKTFTTGEVLTAADTNTYLANSGLVYITGGALSSTAVNFAGCFTSEYRDYRIVVDSVAFNASGAFYYQFLTGTTPETAANYFWAMSGLKANSVAYNNGSQTQTYGYLGTANVGANNLVIGSCSWDICGPQLAQRTLLTGQGGGVDTEYFHYSGMNAHNLTNAYTGIRFLTNTATTFTGNVSIYGYRKA